MIPRHNDELEAELDALAGGNENISLVCVGDIIFGDGQEGYLRGHGTMTDGESLRATQCGVVQQVNKLVSVQCLQQRHSAEMGDVVIGRVTEIRQKRWKLDLQSRQEAFLMLSAVNLPGGIQRRRTVEDELNMRSVYEEGDLLVAEVQALYHDGSVALQTRSAKYGKLKNGSLVAVRANLVPRQRQHFSAIGTTGVSVILGVNGLCWVTRSSDGQPDPDAASTADTRQKVARIANCIRVLAQLSLPITPSRIAEIYQESEARRCSTSSVLESAFVSSVIKREAQQRLVTAE